MYKKLSIIDIDETIFNTFSTIGVMHSGVRVKDLTNQEYNGHNLKEGETYDFEQFQDAKFFYDTSMPIEKSVKWVKRILASIEKNKTNNDHLILFLTARGIPDNRELFFDKFEKHGMIVRAPDVEFAYSGDMDKKLYKTTQIRKSRVLNWYLNIYPNLKSIRMYDDDTNNLETFASVIEDHNEKKDNLIKFYSYKVLHDGALQRI